jgi:hypothetical protein
MARPSRGDMDRRATKNALYKALSDKGLGQKYYGDQVDEYMKYYDNLAELNACLEAEMDVNILKEKRQVTKEMRGILAFLELTPSENGGDGYEEL